VVKVQNNRQVPERSRGPTRIFGDWITPYVPYLCRIGQGKHPCPKKNWESGVIGTTRRQPLAVSSLVNPFPRPLSYRPRVSETMGETAYASCVVIIIIPPPTVVAWGILLYCWSFFLYFSFAKRSLSWLYRQGTYLAQMVGYRCNFKNGSKIWGVTRH